MSARSDVMVAAGGSLVEETVFTALLARRPGGAQ